jgi:3-methyladenine DNA glycosylase/8-oxoguanine DNA glycosylase
MPSRTIRPDGPLALGATVSCLRHGASDPTCRVVGAGGPTATGRSPGGGEWWFGEATPAGPATLHLRQLADGTVEAEAWGEGADWSLGRVPALVGLEDDRSGFVAHHDVATAGLKANPGWRIAKSRLVTQSLVPAIIEQRVTGKEAFAGHARLVRRFGQPAPGPGERLGLMIPPAPREWALIPSWEWLGAGIDRARSAAAVRASSLAGRIEECAELPLAQAHSRLRSLPGVGEWTAAEVAQRALGDPDSPSFGDYHLAKNLTWALDGVIGDDDRARELLAPYVGHRYRAAVYIGMAAGMRPRRGPRMTLPTHLPRFR